MGSPNKPSVLDIVTARYITAQMKINKAWMDSIFASDPLMARLKDPPDPFEEFVRETREAAGVEVPPRDPASGGGREVSEYVALNGGKGGKKKA